MPVPKIPKCFCGESSIMVDSWFQYQPCTFHSSLNPNEYKDESEKKNAVALAWKLIENKHLKFYNEMMQPDKYDKC
jgi:hypothetical protein